MAIHSSYLLHGKYKIPGSIFTVIGICLLLVRFYWGIKPEWLELNVFAVYSAYLDVKYMTIIQNQLAEEIAMLFLITGLYMLAFSKEKNETAYTNTLRLKALIMSMWINGAVILFSILFTYGLGFAFMMMIDSILLIAIYIVVFRMMLLRNLKFKQ